jgi:hypothetical protein
MVFGARTAVQGRFRFAGPSSSPEGEDSPVRVLVVQDERRLAAEGFAVGTALDGTDGLLVADGG